MQNLIRNLPKQKNLPSVILNLIQNLSEAKVKTYTDPESTFVASACECGVAVQGDGFQVPDPMFKYCKLILAGIGGVAKPLPQGGNGAGRDPRNPAKPVKLPPWHFYAQLFFLKLASFLR